MNRARSSPCTRILLTVWTAGTMWGAELTPPGVSAAGNEETELRLTVESAIRLCLERNRALKVERWNPAIRRTYEQQQVAIFRPTASAGFSLARERSVTGSAASENTVRQHGDTATATAGIFQRFVSGTELSAALKTERREAEASEDGYTTRLGLTLTQPLLRGVGVRVNLADFRQVSLDSRISDYELRGFVEKLVAEVEATYWNYVLARRQIEIYEQSLSLAEQQLRETQERIAVGKLPETEMAAARAEVALRREALINARSNLEAVRLRFLRLMNLSGKDPWMANPVLESLPVVPPIQVDDVQPHCEVALKMRPDLNQARLALERGELEVVKTRNGLLPRLDFFVGLGKTAYARSFLESVPDPDEQNYDLTAGMNFQLPLFNDDARARHRRAIYSREQALEAIENKSQAVSYTHL
ncbi:MAG: TolC family protein, partial [Kiritimatiellae bacterium]|nr:TolC family protein [Kiritimatiellia bacterium]